MRRQGILKKRKFSLSTRRMRRILSWKFVFYDLLLPALHRRGAARDDAVTGPFGPADDGGAAAAPAATPDGARARQCRARCGLADRHDLARACSQHGTVSRA